MSWWTAENDRLDWHRLSGYAILTLVLFRIFWGFVGGTAARFASFVRGPEAFFAYARHLFDRPVPGRPGSGRPGSGRAVAGHNPMGGWSVLALLVLLLLQAGLGLFAIDVDGLEAGPLDKLIDFDTGRLIARWHGWIFDVLLFLILLHLAFVIFYLAYKRDNLISAMVTGKKTMPAESSGPELAFAPLWRAAASMAAAALIVAWIALGGL